MRKQCLHFFSAVLDLILFILACNDNIHESFDGFEISSVENYMCKRFTNTVDPD